MSADQKLSKEDMFMILCNQLSSSAWVQLGKLPDPVTNKTNRHLEAASLTIDILDALAEKTKGNLSEEEDRYLSGTLSQLKLNYLEEMKKPDPATGKTDPKAQEEAEGSAPNKE